MNAQTSLLRLLRRDAAAILAREGWETSSIALLLGVDPRTISRDLAKLRAMKARRRSRGANGS
jgi:predicted DNA-binding transcriptional regulator YafY